MKLAEALLERADIKQKLSILSNRLVGNAKVQEGLKPNEDPKALMRELDEKLERYEFLIVHINRTNELTKAKSGETISELIAKRDVLNESLRILSNFINAGNMLYSRLTHSEIRILPTMSIADCQKQLDKVAEKIRKIDTTIQELNWTTELI